MAISKTQKWVVTGAASLGALLGAAGIANAATSDTTPPSAPTAETKDAPDPETTPKFTSSVTVADTGVERSDDTAEAAELQALTTLTPDEAKAAAVATTPGTAGDVELDNEDGNVVYSVEVTTGAGKVDVKVDPGNGAILAQESDAKDSEKADDAQRDSGRAIDDHADGETDDDTPAATTTP